MEARCRAVLPFGRRSRQAGPPRGAAARPRSVPCAQRRSDQVARAVPGRRRRGRWSYRIDPGAPRAAASARNGGNGACQSLPAPHLRWSEPIDGGVHVAAADRPAGPSRRPRRGRPRARIPWLRPADNHPAWSGGRFRARVVPGSSPAERRHRPATGPTPVLAERCRAESGDHRDRRRPGPGRWVAPPAALPTPARSTAPLATRAGGSRPLQTVAAWIFGAGLPAGTVRFDSLPPLASVEPCPKPPPGGRRPPAVEDDEVGPPLGPRGRITRCGAHPRPRRGPDRGEDGTSSATEAPPTGQAPAARARNGIEWTMPASSRRCWSRQLRTR